jgi:hypothetical protein
MYVAGENPDRLRSALSIPRRGCGDSAVVRAARYKPSPKTVWVARLLIESMTGLGALEEAIPAPNASCRMKCGATTVAIPMLSAGSKVGLRAHCNPSTASRRAAKVIQME